MRRFHRFEIVASEASGPTLQGELPLLYGTTLLLFLKPEARGLKPLPQAYSFKSQAYADD